MLVPLLLLAALAVPGPAAEGPVVPPTPPGRAAQEQPDNRPGGPPAEEAAPATDDGRHRRALDLLAADEGGRARLVEEATAGNPAARRAALEALATLAGGETPRGTLEAALGALGSGDPLLRRAGVHALLACGPVAVDAVQARLAGVLEAPHGRGPSLAAAMGYARRLRDALADLRRADVERDFLGLWSSDDGTFRGMYESLRRHGPFGAKVLTAMALDRRMAAGDVLGYGPYAWLHAAAGERERNDCRFRALEALADAGDAASREMLRTSLREEPAKELYDELDTDPIPAALDDALREAIAALGDPLPLSDMIVASAEADHGPWDETVELRRRAGARSVLAAADPEVRLQYLAEAERDLRQSLDNKRSYGIPIDGVEYYNLACLLARRDAPKDVGGTRDRGEKEWLLSDRAVALKYLRKSLRTYSVSSAWMEKDGDLRSLRDEPEFKAIVAELRAREKALEKGLPPK